MYEGIYKHILNAQGLSALTKNPDLPDVKLGVGFAESMSPHPLVLRVSAPAPKIDPVSVRTDDELVTQGLGTNRSQADFPQYGYLGEGLGGF